MARRPKKVEVASLPPRNAKVMTFTVPARNLVTIDEDHALWKIETPRKVKTEIFFGAIVRLRPPADVEDGRVEAIKRLLAEAGVSRIKLEVRKGATLPTEAVEKAKPTRSSAREVVLQLVAEANSKEPAALLEIVERTMAGEGL